MCGRVATLGHGVVQGFEACRGHEQEVGKLRLPRVNLQIDVKQLSQEKAMPMLASNPLRTLRLGVNGVSFELVALPTCDRHVLLLARGFKVLVIGKYSDVEEASLEVVEVVPFFLERTSNAWSLVPRFPTHSWMLDGSSKNYVHSDLMPASDKAQR